MSSSRATSPLPPSPVAAYTTPQRKSGPDFAATGWSGEPLYAVSSGTSSGVAQSMPVRALDALLGLPSWLLLHPILAVVRLTVILYNVVRISADVSMYLLVSVTASWLHWWNFVPLTPWNLASTLQIRRVQQALARATTARHWAEIAHKLDKLSGAEAWRAADDGTVDEAALRRAAASLAALRADDDPDSVLFMLPALLAPEFGGQAQQLLWGQALCGTKTVVHEFQRELLATLRWLAAHDAVSAQAKLEFFSSARLAMGRSALALSGGGSLSMYHLGVTYALLQAGLLPRVVSGTSGGSIVAAMLAAKTDDELWDTVLVPEVVTAHHKRWFPPMREQVRNFLRSVVSRGPAYTVESAQFAETCQAYFGDVTFGEAFARTNRLVSISVTVGHAGGSRPLLLNYITAPNVLLWSAVAASCALPGLMVPVTLMAKNHVGQVVPAHDGAHVLDGSMHSDVPAEQLSLLFRVRRTIVSQVNPHVAPFMQQGRRPGQGRSVLAALRSYLYWLNLDVRQRLRKLAKLKLLPRFFGQEFGTVFTQRYTGHLTITPYNGLLSLHKALRNPTVTDMKEYLAVGQAATWPHLPAARHMMAVELVLRDICQQLEQAVVQAPTQPPKFAHNRRDSSKAALSAAASFASLAPRQPGGTLPGAGTGTGPPSAPWSDTPASARHAGANRRDRATSLAGSMVSMVSTELEFSHAAGITALSPDRPMASPGLTGIVEHDVHHSGGSGSNSAAGSESERVPSLDLSSSVHAGAAPLLASFAHLAEQPPAMTPPLSAQAAEVSSAVMLPNVRLGSNLASQVGSSMTPKLTPATHAPVSPTLSGAGSQLSSVDASALHEAASSDTTSQADFPDVHDAHTLPALAQRASRAAFRSEQQ